MSFEEEEGTAKKLPPTAVGAVAMPPDSDLEVAKPDEDIDADYSEDEFEQEAEHVTTVTTRTTNETGEHLQPGEYEEIVTTTITTITITNPDGTTEVVQQDSATADTVQAGGMDEDEAAAKLQAIARGRAARAEVAAMKSSSDSKAEAVEDDEDGYSDDEFAAEVDPEQEAAATRLQSFHRGKQARAEVAAMREQKEQEAAATRLQSFHRGKQARAEVATMREQKEREQAATRIQATARGRRDRQRVAAMRSSSDSKADEAEAEEDEGGYSDDEFAAEVDPEQEAAATRLQSFHRGKQARAEVAAMREQKEQEQAATRLQSFHRGKQARAEVAAMREQKEQEEAATAVQAAVRGKAARQRLAQEQQAATRIQATARGRRDRQRVAAMRSSSDSKADEAEAEDDEGGYSDDEFAAEVDPEQEAAATRLQSFHRGKQARAEVAAMREQKEQEEAATAVQAAVRGKAARQRLAQEQQAATRIQATARGRRDRKRVAAMRGSGIDEDEQEQQRLAQQRQAEASEAELEEAAVTLQAAMRGKLQRDEHAKAVRERREAATRIQAVQRGRQARSEVKHRRAHAAMTAASDAGAAGSEAEEEGYSDDEFHEEAHDASKAVLRGAEEVTVTTKSSSTAREEKGGRSVVRTTRTTTTTTSSSSSGSKGQMQPRRPSPRASSPQATPWRSPRARDDARRGKAKEEEEQQQQPRKPKRKPRKKVDTSDMVWGIDGRRHTREEAERMQAEQAALAAAKKAKQREAALARAGQVSEKEKQRARRERRRRRKARERAMAEAEAQRAERMEADAASPLKMKGSLVPRLPQVGSFRKDASESQLPLFTRNTAVDRGEPTLLGSHTSRAAERSPERVHLPQMPASARGHAEHKRSQQRLMRGRRYKQPGEEAPTTRRAIVEDISARAYRRYSQSEDAKTQAALGNYLIGQPIAQLPVIENPEDARQFITRIAPGENVTLEASRRKLPKRPHVLKVRAKARINSHWRPSTRNFMRRAARGAKESPRDHSDYMQRYLRKRNKLSHKRKLYEKRQAERMKLVEDAYTDVPEVPAELPPSPVRRRKKHHHSRSHIARRHRKAAAMRRAAPGATGSTAGKDGSGEVGEDEMALAAMILDGMEADLANQ